MKLTQKIEQWKQFLTLTQELFTYYSTFPNPRFKDEEDLLKWIEDFNYNIHEMMLDTVESYLEDTSEPATELEQAWFKAYHMLPAPDLN